ncbi:hypothetical protein GCM10022259_27990 [Aquimarina mytili]
MRFLKNKKLVIRLFSVKKQPTYWYYSSVRGVFCNKSLKRFRLTVNTLEEPDIFENKHNY